MMYKSHCAGQEITKSDIRKMADPVRQSSGDLLFITREQNASAAKQLAGLDRGLEKLSGMPDQRAWREYNRGLSIVEEILNLV
jgi:hypothetical protein